MDPNNLTEQCVNPVPAHKVSSKIEVVCEELPTIYLTFDLVGNVICGDMIFDPNGKEIKGQKGRRS